MAEAWPLNLPHTDKFVLLALADSANDEIDGRTWIPVVSRQSLTRAGRVRLSLVVKTGLGETAIRSAIKRLIKAGHITREEKPGIGCTYWVHPVSSTPTPGEGVRDATPALREPTSSAGEGDPLASREENQKKPKQPGAGVREGVSRDPRPTESTSGGPASAPRSSHGAVEERMGEGKREKHVRDRIAIDAKGEPEWLASGALKVKPIADDDGPVGLVVFVHFCDRDRVERSSRALERSASAALGVPVRWVRVEVVRRPRF